MNTETRLLGQSTQLLNSLNGHDQTPAQVLGMTSPFVLTEKQLELAYIRERLPEHILVEQDNTFIFSMNDMVSRGLLAEIPPGSLIGLSFSPRELLTLDPNALAATEALAMIVQNSDQRTVLQPFVPVRMQEEKMVRTPWNLEPDEFGFNQKQIAMAGIQRMFDPQKGIEGSQMNSVFDLTQSFDGTASVTSLGCESHNIPLKAIGQNILRASTVQTKLIEITDKLPGAYIRIGSDGNRGVALETPELNEDLLMYYAMLDEADRIAVTNPSGLGSGTNPNKVFESLVQHTIALPEVAMNGATIEVARTNFINSLK